MHEVISAIFITILLYNLSNSLDNIQKTPSIQTVSSSEVIFDNSHWSVQPPSSFLSSIDLLRLGSILLDLQEQWWVASNADGRLADSNLPPSAVSRLHTSYDDLRASSATRKTTWVRSSWSKRDSSTRRTPWPDSATSRATERSSTKTSSDCEARERLAAGRPRWHFCERPKRSARLQRAVAQNDELICMLPTLFWSTTSLAAASSSQLCSSSNSEFLVSANSEDGSVCIWNSAVRLFVAGRLNLKQIRASNLPRFL